MPTYEYRCGKCGVFEASGRITEPALKRCPTCKGKVERLMSLTSFVLKGSGWYATDYARAGGTKPDSSADSTATETKTNGAAAATPSTSDSSSNSTTKTASSDSPAKSPAKSKSPPAKSTD